VSTDEVTTEEEATEETRTKETPAAIDKQPSDVAPKPENNAPVQSAPIKSETAPERFYTDVPYEEDLEDNAVAYNNLPLMAVLGDVQSPASKYNPQQLSTLPAEPLPEFKFRSRNKGWFVEGSLLMEAGDFSWGSWPEPDQNQRAAKIEVMSDSEYEESNITYIPPIELSLKLSRLIGKRMSVGAGLIYTRLVAHGTRFTETTYQDITTRSTYIGFPLEAKIDYIQGRKFTIYQSLGVIFSAGVGRKEHESYWENDDLIYSQRTKTGLDEYMTRITAGAGMRFNIWDRTGLYFEPGIAVLASSTDNNEFNIFNYHKIWPDMHVGARITL